jgi:hypothetical protein
VKDRQVVEDICSQLIRRLFMVCRYLSSGREGNEQDRPVEGTMTSTLVSAHGIRYKCVSKKEKGVRIILQIRNPKWRFNSESKC